MVPTVRRCSLSGPCKCWGASETLTFAPSMPGPAQKEVPAHQEPPISCPSSSLGPLPSSLKKTSLS